MRMPTDVRSLKKAGLFKQLTDREIQDLAGRMTSRKYREGETIFAQGDDAESLYVVLSGSVQIQLESERGTTVTLAEIEQGEHFGELPLFDRQSRVAGAVASDDAEIAELPYAAVEAAAGASAETGKKLYYAFARTLCERMRMTNEDLVEFHESFPFFAT